MFAYQYFGAMPVRLIWSFVLVANNRDLFCLNAVLGFLGDTALQSENHIGCSLKISRFFTPAHTVFTMLESDKLLLCRPTTVNTFSFGSTLLVAAKMEHGNCFATPHCGRAAGHSYSDHSFKTGSSSVHFIIVEVYGSSFSFKAV